MKKTPKELSVKTSRRTFMSQIQRKRMTFKNKNIKRYVLKGQATPLIYIPTDKT